MIDMCMYRIRVGSFNATRRGVWGRGREGRGLVTIKTHYPLTLMTHTHSSTPSSSSPITDSHPVTTVLCGFLYIYFALIFCTLSAIIQIFAIKGSAVSGEFNFSWYSPGLTNVLILNAVSLKTAYLYLMSTAILGIVVHRRPTISNFSTLKRTSRVLKFLYLAILTLNFLLIAICNPSMLNPGPGSLNVCYQNIQGLIPFSQLGEAHPTLNVTKILELNAFITKSQPDVVLLNETWLKKSIKDHEIIQSRNYTVFRSDRSQLTHPSDPSNPKKFRKYGGGVLIAVRSDIEASVKRISMRKGAEIAAIELQVGLQKHVFCTIYRVGTLGELNHSSIISSLQSFYGGRTHNKIFVVGDFNLSSVEWPATQVNNSATRVEKMFVESFSELGLEQLVNSPTHNKGKILDLLLTNSSTLVKDIKVLENTMICKSDHYPITFSVVCKANRLKPPKRQIYNFKRANWDQLNRDIGSINWHETIDGMEPELAWKRFKDLLFVLINRSIPRINLNGNFTSPWFDSECFEAYRSKERAHTKFKSTPCLHNELKRDSTRKNFKKICSIKMRENLYNSDDPALITKKFWSHVKADSKSHRIPECVHRQGRYRSTPKEKCDLFNDFFFDQFSEESNYGIPIDWSNDEAFDIEFCPSKIENLLKNINSNKAYGPDEIHGKILKNCSRSLSTPLSLLFSLSYNTGSIPKDWKIANIVPVHKKGPKDDVENYRPISLTSLVMKTFERIIKEELLFRVMPLLDQRQHGFLNDESCTTNMASFSDSVVLSINDCKTFGVDVVYFDFSKAFDSVSHDLILYKLKYYFGIEGRLLKFIENYLYGREQCVVLNNVKSSLKPVISGVPQGSILGPIFFVIFINDLPACLNEGTQIALYADDTKIWRSICSDHDHVMLQKDIDNLNDWAMRNKMKFHPRKCKVVSLCHRESPLTARSSLGVFTLPFIDFHYTIGEDSLEYADTEKDLGILINSSFDFTDHIDALISKANQQFGLLRRTCHFVQDIRRRRSLYLTLVRSQFEHCSPIWRPFSKKNLEKFDGFQKKCIKWILSEEEHSYHSLNCYSRKCRQANILPLCKRFDFNDLILFHKVVHQDIPLKLPAYLKFYDGSSRLRSTHLDSLSIVSEILPRASAPNLLNKSFFYRTHSLWNHLPNEIRSIASKSLFRARLETFLWEDIMTNPDESIT